MLTTIRDKASGWVAGIIVGALILSFALWGVGSYVGGGDVNVATVNGTDIKLQSFQRSFYNLRQQMQSMFGGTISLEEDDLIKEQTLDKLINTELVNQIIKDTNLRISNAKVVETIKNLEFFKDEEGFDRIKYERAINSLGMDPVLFEQQLRMDLLSEQLQAGLSESLFVLDSELQDVIRLKSQARDITYAIVDLASFIGEGEIGEDQIEAFYKANPERYADPEKVKIAYLELDVNELAKSIETDEENLRAYYADNKDQYDVVEQRSVTKLFIKTAEEDADKKIIEATEEVKAKAKITIESALVMVKEGKSFEEVIEAFTEEGKGALEFSEHSFMTKGIMDEEIDDFLFTADEDAVSEVIETKTGLNIVKVGEIRGGPKNNYENVAEKVEQDYKKSEAELQFFELADQLTTLSYEHSDSLEIAAEAIGSSVVETDYFSREDNKEGILANSTIISNSFDPELMSSGQNSDAISLSNNHIVVLRILDHKIATTKPLDDVRDEVIAHVRFEQAGKKIKEFSDSVVEQLNAGIRTDAIVSDTEIEWTSVEKIKRDDISVNRAVLRNAFQAGTPSDDTPVITSNRLGSGDYAIIMVTATHDTEEVAAEDETARKSTDLELRRARGNSEWQNFIQNTRENADIKLYKDNI